MAIDQEVLELVQILSEEGFGVVAGDLLAEIGALADENYAVDEDSEETDLKVAEHALAEGDQLGEALRIIQLRLVEPARHLAEAERIAAGMTDAKPVQIRFVRADGSEPGEAATRALAGTSTAADKLETTLWRIAATRPPIQI